MLNTGNQELSTESREPETWKRESLRQCIFV